ncbi:MAG: sulfatase, partial [Deltaproteobacteria bacterium]|nr:sulfatase [Deltaproteobacteria bacterium]
GRAAALALGASLASAPLLAALLDSVAAGAVLALALAVSSLVVLRHRSLPLLPTRAAAALGASALLACAVLPTSLRPAVPAEGGPMLRGRPDLVLVSVDTLRADALHGDLTCTPHLARLRERGVSARYALAPSSLTLPSHATMLSGRPIDEHRVYDNHGELPDTLVLLPERLREAGYRTAAVVSNYLIRSDAGFARGVEVYDDAPINHGGPVETFREQVRRATWWGWLAGGVPGAADRWLFGARTPEADADRGNARRTTDHALGLMRQLQSGQAPYYLFVHYMDPHAPYVPPAGDDCPADRASRPDARLPARYGDGEAVEVNWRFLQRIAKDLRAGVPEAQQANAWVRALYDREVRYVDRVLGELLEQVDRSGRPTVVLLTSDHGEQFGDHGYMAHGDSLYEAALRVPFVLAGQGVAAGRLEHPAHLLDVAPTLLGLAGLRTPELGGIDLSRERPGARPHLARAARQVALRDAHGYKVLFELDPDSKPRLYALTDDPGETRDLRDSDVARTTRLVDRAREAFAGAPPEPAHELTEEHRAALRALGYVGD